MNRLVGIPILLVGLAMLWFNGPLARLNLKLTVTVPRRQKQSKAFQAFNRVACVLVGAGAVFIGVGVLVGFLTNNNN